MDKRVLVWLIMLVFLALSLGYLMTGDKTTTTTTLQEAASTTFSPTTTRAITRPTQPTTTLQTTTFSSTSTTIQSSSNATTTSTTATTQPDHTNPQTTTTTIPGATTTTQVGATSTTVSGSTTTTAPGATTTTMQDATTTSTTQSGTTTTIPSTTTSKATTTSTTTTTRTTTSSTRTSTTSTTITTTTSTTVPALSGPVLYLKFDESAGTTAYDSIGGNDGDLVNGPTWTSGRSGNAIRLDGINDYAYIGTTSSLNLYNSITIAAWIKPTTVAKTQDIICRNWQISYSGYELRTSEDGEVMFRINPTTSSYAYRSSSGLALAANVWQHVAVTYDGTNIRFYKNGALISTVAAGGRLYPGSSDIYIGVYESETDNLFSGAIDELRIYDKALSSAEISQIYTPLTTTSTSSTTTTTTSSTTRTTTSSTTTTTTTLPPSSCRVGGGYTFSSAGTYTANSASGAASISRSGQYTFYETPHSYTDYLSCPWSGTYTCPTGTNIRFYLRAQTESGYDFLNIRNSGGTTYEQIDGDGGSAYAWTATYSQRTAAFQFTSDRATVNWGVDLYQIGCGTTTTTTTTTTRTTTTTTRIGEECYGSDCNPTGSPVGGGPGYAHIITSTDPRIAYTVTTASQLRSALNSATSGQIVFVPSTASIDLTGTSAMTIKAGVILASDRGYAGSSGGLIYRTDETSHIGTFIVGGNNVRITGLRIRGPHSGYGTDYGDEVKCAIIEENKNGLEVDNCEIYYWSYAAVALENTASGTWSAHIHHNNLHHNAGKGYGYGVMVAYGNALVEANLFDYTRHAVIGEGCSGESFEWRYNTHGTHCIDGILDLHRDCGGWTAGGTSGRLYKIHHNTVTYDGNYFLNTYGTPTEGLYINNNRMETGILARNGETRIYMTNNYVGGTFYSQGPID